MILSYIYAICKPGDEGQSRRQGLNKNQFISSIEECSEDIDDK